MNTAGRVDARLILANTFGHVECPRYPSGTVADAFQAGNRRWFRVGECPLQGDEFSHSPTATLRARGSAGHSPRAPIRSRGRGWMESC